MNLGWRAYLNLGLGVLCALLAGLGMWLVWLWLADATPASATAMRSAPPALATPQAGVRDPFLPPGGTAMAGRTEDAWQVLGVAIEGDQALALVSVGGRVRKLRVGDKLGGYVLREIRADSLLFQASPGEGTREVRLKKPAETVPSRPVRAGPRPGR